MNYLKKLRLLLYSLLKQELVRYRNSWWSNTTIRPLKLTQNQRLHLQVMAADLTNNRLKISMKGNFVIAGKGKIHWFELLHIYLLPKIRKHLNLYISLEDVERGVHPVDYLYQFYKLWDEKRIRN